MEFTLTSLFKWLLDILNSAVPIIIGVVIAWRINKLIERKDEDENPEEKEENNYTLCN